MIVFQKKYSLGDGPSSRVSWEWSIATFTWPFSVGNDREKLQLFVSLDTTDFTSRLSNLSFWKNQSSTSSENG